MVKLLVIIPILFTIGTPKSWGQECGFINGMPESEVRASSLGSLVGFESCSTQEYLVTPCECYQKEPAFHQQVLSGSMIPFKELEIKKVYDLYKEDKAQEYLKKVSLITQKTLYLDQLSSLGFISKNNVNRIPNCSYSAILAKLKNQIPASCQQGMSEKFTIYFKKENINSLEDFVVQLSNEQQNIVDFKKHREKSCLPYKEYLNISMLNEHTNTRLNKALYNTFMRSLRKKSRINDYMADFNSLAGFDVRFASQSVENGKILTNQRAYLSYVSSFYKRNLSLNPFFKVVDQNKALKVKLAHRFKDQNDLAKKCRRDKDESQWGDCPKSVSFQELFYEDDEVTSLALAQMDQECQSLFDGEALKNILCEERPDIPFEELVQSKSFLALPASKVDPVMAAKSLKIKNQCIIDQEAKTAKRKRPLVNISEKLSVIDLDISQRVEDLASKEPDAKTHFVKKTMYEQMDQMTCEIFPDCKDGSDPNCSKPEFLTYQLAKKFTKEFAPFGKEFREKGKPPIETACANISAFGFYKKVNPERMLNYCKMYKYFKYSFDKVDPVNVFNGRGFAGGETFARRFNSISRQNAGLGSCEVSMIQGGCDATDVKPTSPSNTFFGNADTNAVATSDANTFSNYTTRSTETDYQNVLNSNGDINVSTYTPRSSYGGKTYQPEPIVSLKEDNFIIDNPSVDINTSLPAIEVSRQTSTIVERKSDKEEVQRADGNLSSEKKEQLTITVKSKTEPKEIKQLEKEREVVKSKEKSVADEQKKLKDLYSQFSKEQTDPEFEQRRKEIAAEIERTRNKINTMMKENEQLRNQRNALNNTASVDNTSNEYNPFDNEFESPEGTTLFSSTSSGNALKEFGEDAPEKEVKDEDLAVVGGTGGKTEKALGEKGAMAQGKGSKNKVLAAGRAGRGIASIREGKPYLEKLPKEFFTRDGSIKKFIPAPFVIAVGLDDSIVLPKFIGDKKIGVVEYVPNAKKPHVMVYFVEYIIKDEDKVEGYVAAKDLKVKAQAYKEKNKTSKLYKLAKHYKVVKKVKMDFDARKNDIFQFAYTNSELWNKAIGEESIWD